MVGSLEEELQLWLLLCFDPWPDSSTPLAGITTASSHLWWRNLQQGSVAVVIIIHNIVSEDRLHYQILTLAIAIHHKQISISLPLQGLERFPGDATFAPAGPGLGGPGGSLRLRPNDVHSSQVWHSGDAVRSIVAAS